MSSEHPIADLTESFERKKRLETERRKEFQGLQVKLQVEFDKGSEAAIMALFKELYERFRRSENESIIQADLLNMLEKDTQVLKKGIEILQEKNDKLEAALKAAQEELQALQEKGPNSPLGSGPME